MPAYREIAEFYDYEYGDGPLEGRDVPFFLEHVSGRRVVEIGCGTGRATLALAAAGRDVVGFDHDAGVLGVASSKPDPGGVTFVEADAADEDWADATGTGFDAACCFFNTFLALADAGDQEACLRGARRALRDGGALWLDVFHPNLELLVSADASTGGVSEIEPDVFALPDGRTILRTTAIYHSLTAQRQDVTFTYTWYEAGVRVERHRDFAMTWVMPREMRRLLRLCGFEVVTIFGDYDGGEIDDTSERQIVLARAF